MPGVCWTVHRTPFHRSASVRAPPAEDPTATQAVGEGHDTPLSRLAWAGLGAGMIRHRDPFHRSVSVASRYVGDGMALAPRLASPTAMQNRAVTHETAARVRFCGTGVGRGTRSARHARPFQRAVTGRVPAGGPTAWQEPGAGHDTLPIGPSGEPGTIDQRVPVHASAGVPTARQEAAVAQDTSSSRLSWPWLGAGSASHARPFHRMARVSEGPVAP
jgi:hypothetical protein